MSEDRTESAASAKGESASRRAYSELLAVLAEIDRDYLATTRGIARPDDVATGLRFVLDLLGSGLDLALACDPRRPEFRPTMSFGRKIYGDNPDALYQSTVIDPALRYRIRGNVCGAVYTSFTVEGGGSLDERYPPARVVATLADGRMEIAPDGRYSLVASVEPHPGPEPWLPLSPDTCSIVTRHYFEGEAPVDRRRSIPIEVEVMGGDAIGNGTIEGERIERVQSQDGASSGARDAVLARGIRRVVNFVRGLSLDYGRNGPVIDFASREPNRFGPPSGWSGEPGQGPVDQSNLWAPFALADDQALVIEGRFPRCRFGSLVVWNRHLQSLGRPGTRASLNRRQTCLEPDGSFRILVAGRDPGSPNWLDTNGEREGVVFVRYLLPEERPGELRTRVTKLPS